MFAVYNDDIVISITNSPIFSPVIEIPSELNNLTIDQLRVSDGTLVNVSATTTFYVDTDGNQHIHQNSDNSWQELQCSYDDVIEKNTSGTWVVVTLKYSQQQKSLDVHTYRQSLENHGFYVDNYFVDSSLIGRVNLMATLRAYDSNLIPSGSTVNWKFSSADFEPVGLSELQLFSKYLTQYLEGLFNNEKQHMNNIAALTNISDVNNYDYSTGWPATNYTSSTT